MLSPSWSCSLYRITIMNADNHFSIGTRLFCFSSHGSITLISMGENSRRLHHDKGLIGENDILIKVSSICLSFHYKFQGKEYAPWWRVYLKGVYTISKVSILHRGDCCRRKLTHKKFLASLFSSISSSSS